MSETATTEQEFDSQSVIVERAIPTDAEGIFEVQRCTWLATYPNADAGITEEDIRVRLEGKNGELIPQKVERCRNGIEATNNERATFVVHDNGRVVGFVAPVIRDGQRRIGAIYVLPEAQGRGIGRELLERAIEWHGRDEDIFLHVASYNQSAIEFYKKNGFEVTGAEIKDEIAKLNNYTEIPQIEMVLRAKLT
ncbi:MAG: GNAT family N-acetyltransferase [Candidatus Saccharimonas sp.]